MNLNKNILALDIGTNTIGVAIYFKNDEIIVGLTTINYQKEKYEIILNELKKILKKYSVFKIICGYPELSTMNNLKTYIQNYINKVYNFLKENFNEIKFEMISEYYSTKDAIFFLKHISNKKKFLLKNKDIESAKNILQMYINSLKYKN